MIRWMQPRSQAAHVGESLSPYLSIAQHFFSAAQRRGSHLAPAALSAGLTGHIRKEMAGLLDMCILQRRAHPLVRIMTLRMFTNDVATAFLKRFHVRGQPFILGHQFLDYVFDAIPISGPHAGRPGSESTR